MVLERDRAPELRGGRPGDDRERDLRADPADREQLREELALRGVREAVELERVLADMEKGLHADLTARLGPPHARRASPRRGSRRR